MPKFVLTASLALQTNLQSIERARQQIRKGLAGGLTQSVKINVDTSQLIPAQAQIKGLQSNLRATADISQTATAAASKGFTSLTASLARTITTGAALFSVFSELRTAAHEAIDFAKSITQVGQVTNKTGRELSNIQGYIEKLTTTYGVAGAGIAQAFKKVVSANIPLTDTKEIV